MKTKIVLLSMLFALNFNVFSQSPDNLSATISLKTAGNAAKTYNLKYQKIGTDSQYGNYALLSDNANIPVSILQTYLPDPKKWNDKEKVVDLQTIIIAKEDVNFSFAQLLKVGSLHADCQFLMPGFWYRRNLRSPKEAPSFHTSDSWTVREDRLSTPLTGIYNEKTHNYTTILRIDDFENEALTTHKEGEVIVSGKTSLGYTGFQNVNGTAALAFGFPYHETPKTYIRKLTLAPEVQAFQHLKKGESLTLVWEITYNEAADFSEFVQKVWEYSYDKNQPKPVCTPYTAEIMKETMTNYFNESFVDTHELKYTSGEGLRTDNCLPAGGAEVGFVGRVLLNAFNALEYGEQHNRQDLLEKSRQTFDSYLAHGFTTNGLIREFVNFRNKHETDVFSIRRQSEGAYALLYYLQYEKNKGRKHTEWEKKLQTLLDQILKTQKEDGSFPRKFKDDLTVVDNSGGSTPSATPMLVLASEYFKNKKYLEAAKKTANYLEQEIISKADYFSSTLDANCEDKEASYYASTALYHLAQFTKGSESEYYAALAKTTAYFCLSWYYTWNVPFAKGQMLGDMGLKTRGWGNVSVENNHIDVYIFDFATILQYLGAKYSEPRFTDFAKVIQTSMCQLLPHTGHLCGIAKTGFYPEVVQHTNWDYGRNGKGYYNDIFAPGWTVASLWEMLSPDRIKLFKK